MAVCGNCGKRARSGQNVSFSQRKTKRVFRANLQKVKVLENDRLVSKILCTKCLKAIAKG